MVHAQKGRTQGMLQSRNRGLEFGNTHVSQWPILKSSFEISQLRVLAAKQLRKPVARGKASQMLPPGGLGGGLAPEKGTGRSRCGNVQISCMQICHFIDPTMIDIVRLIFSCFRRFSFQSAIVDLMLQCECILARYTPAQWIETADPNGENVAGSGLTVILPVVETS